MTHLTVAGLFLGLESHHEVSFRVDNIQYRLLPSFRGSCRALGRLQELLSNFCDLQSIRRSFYD